MLHVYCELSMNNGGYVLFNPSDINVITNDELLAIYVDTTNFLFRVIANHTLSTQLYSILRQLPVNTWVKWHNLWMCIFNQSLAWSFWSRFFDLLTHLICMSNWELLEFLKLHKVSSWNDILFLSLCNNKRGLPVAWLSSMLLALTVGHTTKRPFFSPVNM
jgi:hypothetical protein